LSAGGYDNPSDRCYYKDGSIRIVTMHHEQAVAMAVDAYGRVNNRPTIGFATMGQGQPIY